MYNRFFKGLNKIDDIKKFDNIVLGISGGYDSMCMLHLFERLGEKHGLTIHVVTLNHMIRGDSSTEDMNYVINYCKGRGISCHPYQVDIALYCKKRNISVEEGGRQVRYKLFEKIRDKYGGKYIAIAQNMNDQVETLLMRFLRGTGIDGLAGISKVRKDGVIRPILEFNRDEIEKYCKDYNLNPRLDESNLKTLYTRNKVRLDMLPYIMENLNPNVISTIYNNSFIYRDDSEFLNDYSQSVFAKIIRKKEKGMEILLSDFNNLHISIKRRVIRQIFKEIKGNLKEISSKNIEDIIKLCFRGSNGKFIILYDVKFHIKYDKLTINMGSIEDTDSYFYEFEKDEVFVEEAKCKLLKGTISNDKEINYTKDTIYFDIDKLSGELSIRNRRDGDRFMPLGMGRMKKIKDFFIDNKVPREERNIVPIICTGEDILWISGHRMDDRFKVDKDSLRIGYIKIICSNSKK
ncbi:MAG: tRNA lysidine(34) synthetase TilS [Firmicutes bacterium]|nr:tRNA lysidine(34) synthetase TilS [Bacillota bacterium]